MKKKSNILRYLTNFVLYLVIIVAIDKLIGEPSEKGVWYFCIQALVFVIALELAQTAQKHGWDTWSGLFSKFKKDKK